MPNYIEDCTQNTFLEARKQISHLRTHPNVEGWLYTTARNLNNHSYRSFYIKKKHEVVLDDNISASLIGFENEMEELFNHTNTMDWDRLCADILGQLNQSEYDLYSDYYKGNLSVSELAKKYDVSGTAMTTRIYRLKKKIKNLIRDYFKDNY